MLEELRRKKKSENDEFNKAYFELFGEDLFEKAKHQIGDSHPKWPQLKWTDLGGGKFGWRTGTGKGKRGNAGGNAGQASVGNSGEQKDLSTHAAKERIAELKKKGGNDTTHPVEQFFEDNKTAFTKLLRDATPSFPTRFKGKVKINGEEREINIKHDIEYGKHVIRIKTSYLDDNAKFYSGSTLSSKDLKGAIQAWIDKEFPNHTASDNAMPHISLSQSDFKKTDLNDEDGDFKNAPLKLHEYTAKSVEYYDNDGNKKKASPFISEYYASSKQDKVGGYEAYFDGSDSIGTFYSLSDAISALNSWVNKMRVKGHPKPKWIYNASKGDYQMHYSLDVPASITKTATTADKKRKKIITN